MKEPPKLKTQKLIISWFLPFKFHKTFKKKNYHALCIVIEFIVLVEEAVAFILWKDVATDCVSSNKNTTTFGGTRLYKISHWANIP